MKPVSRRGTTLLELVVAITILGIVAGVVSLAAWAPPQPGGDEPWVRVRVARDSALLQGRVVTATVMLNGRPANATALPDGRVMADSGLRIRSLTGEVARAR